MVDSAPPFVSRERRAGDGGVWCVLAHEAAGRTARWWRAPSAAVRFALSPPGARGCAPLPPDPYPRQAELAGFCALRARAALRAGVSVLAHGATRMFVLAHGATRRIVLAHAATRCVR